MIRKALITGALVIGMAFTAIHGPRLESSARDFQQYFEALKKADDSVGPLQRFVFSLVLANARNRSSTQQTDVPRHRG
jgi:hypothetical protein